MLGFFYWLFSKYHFVALFNCLTLNVLVKTIQQIFMEEKHYQSAKFVKASKNIYIFVHTAISDHLTGLNLVNAACHF